VVSLAGVLLILSLAYAAILLECIVRIRTAQCRRARSASIWRNTMSHPASEKHKKAAQHHKEAAEHHEKAAQKHDEGQHVEAQEHSLTAAAKGAQAQQSGTQAHSESQKQGG
jgi:hypothetical protein